MDHGAENYRLFLAGEERGLIELIRLYRDGLILYLHSLVGDLHLAEELAEDTFVLLGTKKPRDKGKGSFKTWLYTIGRNRAIDHLRKTARTAALTFDITDETESLETAYIREEQRITLHRMLRTLKPEYRQILWLIYFEGFSQKEAAAVMKKSVHNIETLAYRARKALKAKLEQEGFTYEEL